MVRCLNAPPGGASPRAEPGAAPAPQFSMGDVLGPALLARGSSLLAQELW